MTLLDYFEVNDYLGDAYVRRLLYTRGLRLCSDETLVADAAFLFYTQDFGQIQRILTVDGVNEGHEILSAGSPFYSMFGDWRRLPSVGAQSAATLYFVEGGNASSVGRLLARRFSAIRVLTE